MPARILDGAALAQERRGRVAEQARAFAARYGAVPFLKGAITPMPGGTGPTTIATVLGNTLAAARLQREGRI